MKLARDKGSLVTTYSPLGDGVNANQNVYSWQDKALTYCGFRYNVLLKTNPNSETKLIHQRQLRDFASGSGLSISKTSSVIG